MKAQEAYTQTDTRHHAPSGPCTLATVMGVLNLAKESQETAIPAGKSGVWRRR